MVAKSGNGWKLAPSLDDLIDEVDARWPKRSKSFDGSIGDLAHAARSSEHNPDHDPDPMPAGLVSALDITKDSAAQMEELRKKLIADPRTWYVIHNGKIYSRTHGFKAQAYNGANAHEHHLHVSLMQTAAGAKAGPWKVAVKAPVPPTKPDPKPTTPPVATRTVDLSNVQRAARRDGEGGWPGQVPRDSKTVEDALVAAGLLEAKYADGLFGTASVEAYSKWQKKLGFKGDDANGIPGRESLEKLGVKYGFKVSA